MRGAGLAKRLVGLLDVMNFYFGNTPIFWTLDFSQHVDKWVVNLVMAF